MESRRRGRGFPYAGRMRSGFGQGRARRSFARVEATLRWIRMRCGVGRVDAVRIRQGGMRSGFGWRPGERGGFPPCPLRGWPSPPPGLCSFLAKAGDPSPKLRGRGGKAAPRCSVRRQREPPPSPPPPRAVCGEGPGVGGARHAAGSRPCAMKFNLRRVFWSRWASFASPEGALRGACQARGPHHLSFSGDLPRVPQIFFLPFRENETYSTRQRPINDPVAVEVLIWTRSPGSSPGSRWCCC